MSIYLSQSPILSLLNLSYFLRCFQLCLCSVCQNVGGLCRSLSQVELSERLTGAEADPAILRFSQHFHERMQASLGRFAH